LIGAVLRLFGDNTARAAYLVIERKPFIVVGDVAKEAVNGLSAFCPDRVFRELEGDEVVSSSLKVLRSFDDAERSDPSASRFFLTDYNVSPNTIAKLNSAVPLGWVAVSLNLSSKSDLPPDLPVFNASSSTFERFSSFYELDYEFSLVKKVKALLDEGDEATADEYARLEQKDFYDKAKAFRSLVTKSSKEPSDQFLESLLSGMTRFDLTSLQISKILSLLRSERYENILSVLESKLGLSYREKLMSELQDRSRKPVPLDPLSIFSLPSELVPVAKAMVKLNSAFVDEVAREIKKRKGVTFKLLEELRERGHLTAKKTEGRVKFSLRT
jgi:hypothetical protein